MPAEPDPLEHLLATMSLDRLNVAARRAGRRLMVALGAVVACVLAGIWIDWRFLPTTIVPAAIVTTLGYTSYRFQNEATRRAEDYRAAGLILEAAGALVVAARPFSDHGDGAVRAAIAKVRDAAAAIDKEVPRGS